MKKIKCVVIDDELLARKLLQEFIQKMPQLELVQSFKNPLEAISFLKGNPVDLLFLDIQMPDLTGIEFIRSLREKPVIVLTTAYAEYALEGYELEVTDYLLKPFSMQRFLQAVNKAEELIALKDQAAHQEQPRFLTVHADHKVYKINLADLRYVEGLKEYVSYYTSDQRIIALESLKNLEEKLPADQFIRVHKSYIVSIPKIEALESNQLKIGEKYIPIGRSYKEQVMGKIF